MIWYGKIFAEILSERSKRPTREIRMSRMPVIEDGEGRTLYIAGRE